MPNILLVSVLAVILLCSCDRQPLMNDRSQKPATSDSDRMTLEEAVIEAVFRYQMEHYPLSNFPAARVRCLSMPETTDPTPALLARLSPFGEVRSISNCEITSEVTDTRTGRRGIVLKVERIRDLNDSKALVEGGYYYDALGARDDLYYLARESGGWRVQRAELRSIS